MSVGIARILARFCLPKVQKSQIYGIPNTRVFFISSSAGGFASLYICARNEGYKCLIRNPQIFLGNRELGEIKKLGNLDLSNPCYKERLELGENIVKNKTSRFYMMFNRCSDWDMGNLKQLLAKFGVDNVSRNYYRFGNKHIIVMETSIRVPHNNHCCSFPATIFTRLELYPPDDVEYMLLSLLRANQERCGLQDNDIAKTNIISNLNKQLEQREEEIRKSTIRNLWTARIDVKNFGVDNNVIVTNLLDERPVNITKPDWFKNEEGQGIVVEGASGFAKLSLRFVGRGIMKIDLRGITKFGPYQNRLPYWITFLSFRINGREILQKPVNIWHDKPMTLKKQVQDGEVMIIEFSWCPCRNSVEEILSE